MTDRSRLFSTLVHAAFFCSGAAGLTAEVTWNRMLIVVVGNSLSATAMIVAVFMGGLGIGSYLGGRVLGSRRSLLPYLLLETAVGLYVLASPALLNALAALFSSLAGNGPGRTMLSAVRLLVTSAALLLPAALMGATFPAMISGASPASEDRRAIRIAYLYGANTVGAAIGCFAAGYYMLLELGVRTTIACAFGLYLAAAGCALVANALRSREEARDSGPAVPGPDDAAAAGAARASGVGPRGSGPVAIGPRRFLALATFAIGFVALAYEVLLTRLSILYLGNAVSVFPLVLTGFLLGTGISALAANRAYSAWARSEAGGLRLFGLVSLGAGTAVLAIPYLLLSDRVAGDRSFARLADAMPQNPWPILAVIVAPTVLIGGLLPIAIRMLRGSRRAASTRNAATLYALNTAGGVLGAGLANHFLVPWIGVERTLIALTAICAAIAAASLLSRSRSAVRWVSTAAVLGLLPVVLPAALPGLMRLYSGEIARSTGARSARVRLLREGRAATVAVIDQEDRRLGTYRDMYLNGVEEASTRYWHAQLFKLLGILPVLVHPSEGPKQVLVIAFGAGITAGSVLASDQVARLDVVDLNPDIEAINDLFVDVNGDVFHKPRFHFKNDDGRNYLVTCGDSYDLIIGDSTHPRAYDSWILYTEEFYRAARRRLRPGGIFAQWVPVLGSMEGELMRIHLNTFRRVFPNATLWYVPGSDQAFLLATPEPFALDVPRLQERLQRLPAWFRAGEYQIDTVERLAGFFWMDPPALARMVGPETRINTDDVHYFDKQSALRPLPPQMRLPFFQASVVPYLPGGDPALEGAARAEQATAGRLAAYGFFHSREDLFSAWCSHPENGDVRYFMAREFADSLPDHDTFCRELPARRYRELVALHPHSAEALNALADVLCEVGSLDEALRTVEQAIALEPDNGMILDTFGWILFRRGETARALDVLGRSLALLPEHPIVLYHMGAARMAAGDARGGRSLLEKALRQSNDFPGAEEARKLLGS